MSMVMLAAMSIGVGGLAIFWLPKTVGHADRHDVHEGKEKAEDARTEDGSAMMLRSEDRFVDSFGNPHHKGLTDVEWSQFLDETVGPARALDTEFEIYLNGYRDAPEVNGS